MRLSLLAAGAAISLLAGQASAAILLNDNFNADTQMTNWPGDGDFLSTGAPASVDLIGTGFFDLQPGNGNYVDLDGSTGNGNNPAGQLTGIGHYGPGNFTLQFDLAGNLRGAPAQTTTVSLGSFSQTFAPSASSGFTTQLIHFHSNGGALVFTENGPSTQQGNLLDNVLLTSGIPEPASWAMMLVGFAGLGGLMRARRRTTFA